MSESALVSALDAVKDVAFMERVSITTTPAGVVRLIDSDSAAHKLFDSLRSPSDWTALIPLVDALLSDHVPGHRFAYTEALMAIAVAASKVDIPMAQRFIQELICLSAIPDFHEASAVALQVQDQMLKLMATKRETFPILNDVRAATNFNSSGAYVPWRLAEKHRARVERNHGGQSLEILAERGGLSPLEFVAATRGCYWHELSAELRTGSGAGTELGRLVREFYEEETSRLHVELMELRAACILPGTVSVDPKCMFCKQEAPSPGEIRHRNSCPLAARDRESHAFAANKVQARDSRSKCD